MLVFNGKTMMDTKKNDIYTAKGLTMNRENKETDQQATFLDMRITVSDKIFQVELYDKRDAFGFGIVNFPFTTGNIPKRIGTSVFISQLVRYSRACFEYPPFRTAATTLITKLLKQGLGKQELRNSLKRFYQNYNIKTLYAVSLTALAKDLDLIDWKRDSHTTTTANQRARRQARELGGPWAPCLAHSDVTPGDALFAPQHQQSARLNPSTRRRHRERAM